MKKSTFVFGPLLLLCTALVFAAGQKEAVKGGKITLTMYAYNERTNPVEAPNWDYLRRTSTSCPRRRPSRGRTAGAGAGSWSRTRLDTCWPSA